MLWDKGWADFFPLHMSNFSGTICCKDHHFRNRITLELGSKIKKLKKKKKKKKSSNPLSVGLFLDLCSDLFFRIYIQLSIRLSWHQLSFLKNIIYLFIFGCAGSLLLHRLLSISGKSGAALRFGAWASHCSGSSCCGTWTLGAWAQ